MMLHAETTPEAVSTLKSTSVGWICWW